METSQDDARVWIPTPLMQVAYHSRGAGGKCSNDEPEIGREVDSRWTDVRRANGKPGEVSKGLSWFRRWRHGSDDYSTADLEREIPSFFIRERSVVRFRPRRAAAPYGPPTTHTHSFNVRQISSRSLSRRVG